MRSISTRTAGLIILIAGIWGGLIPFIGPYFHFTLGPTHSWTWTSDRFYLDVLPAIAAVVGGLLLLSAGPRPTGRIGALLALCGGIWFAIGPTISELWRLGGAQGVAHGTRGIRMLEALSYHTGLGVLITALAAFALPGLLLARERTVPAAGAGAATGAGAAAGTGTAAGPGRVPATDAEADAARAPATAAERDRVAGTAAPERAPATRSDV